MASAKDRLRGTLEGADLGKSLTTSADEIADLLAPPKKSARAAREEARPEKATRKSRPGPAGLETAREAETEPAMGQGGGEDASGPARAPEEPLQSAPRARKASQGRRRGTGRATVQRQQGEPKKTLTSEYLGDSLYRLPSGAVGARPTFYLREDQMTALRTSVSARVDFFGRTITEAAQSIFDLMGYNAAALNLPYLEAPRDVTTYEPLLTRKQWEMLFDRAEELLEGQEMTQTDLLRAVSWLIQDALYEKGFGDGRSRRKEFNP